jgi:hypothetical protein
MDKLPKDSVVSQILLSSYVNSNFIVVKNNSSCQIFDIITGKQFFEMKMQSCKKMILLEQDNLLILQDSNSSVYICCVES